MVNLFMPQGSEVATKKKRVATAHDLDRIIVRLPEGLREKLAQRAAANGRSMTAEVVAALEKHLEGADRIAELWQFFQRHREDIERIPLVLAAVEYLEIFAERSGYGQGELSAFRRHEERKAREAARPLITADQVTKIKALLESPDEEARLLKVLEVSSVEEIRDFDRAITLLDLRLNKEDPRA
jgi:plasmid stability protein